MKHRIRKLFALTLVLSMLLSMIPLGTSAESLDEFEDYETLKEIPFEFELEPGDLPFEQLKDAVLAVEDIPSCIDSALAEERGHVNRLYLQEPDDYTVMFQNRDGSKTVYVFSHPVKGMTMTTTASVQVNGSVISFTGSNAITSRIAELSDYNIGYSEIAYIPNGVLSSDGIDLTEDARSWARGESMPSALAYNISGEAAAEYAASISVPYSDVAGIAAVTPGITITPNDPAPLGGMTVMSISYSDLAGLMSFKNTSTNKFLTLTHQPPISLTTRNGIVVAYSQWLMSYDSFFGYVVSNLSNVYNTYLGFDDTDEFIIDSLSYMMDTFSLSIESTADNKVIVTIDCDQIAIGSTGALYEKSEDDDYFPTSCEWEITNKENCTLVSSVSAGATRIEECETYFDAEYSLYPSSATHYSIGLYDAEDNSEFTEEGGYCFTDPGIYTVYYKDKYTCVRSNNFVLIVVDSIEVYESNITYSIRSYVTTADSDNLYLTVNASSRLELSTKNLTSRRVKRSTDDNNSTILCERLSDNSRTFTFKHAGEASNILSGVYITATMSTSQYTGLPDRLLVESDSYNGNYYLTNKDTIANTIKYITDNDLSLTTMNQGGTPFVLLDMGDHFIIAMAQHLTNNVSVIKALKASGDSVVIGEYNPEGADANAFKWYIDQIGVDVPLMKQTGSVWCGPTSYLQVLLGYSENVIGNRYTTTLNIQQSTIKATFTDFVEGEGVRTATFCSRINNGIYLPTGYTCNELETINTDSVRSAITTSLNKGMACMFQTHTGRAPYKEAYNGKGHIICIVGYDEVTDTVLISNCHYGDRTESNKDHLNVFGIYEIDFEDFCEDIKNLWYFTYTE